MMIWIDAQFSPAIANWISSEFSISATPLRDLGLRDANDLDIFFAAKQEAVIVMTKDHDFLQLLDKYGTPPQVIWITCGNTSNTQLKQLLRTTLPNALQLLQSGEILVEISSD